MGVEAHLKEPGYKHGTQNVLLRFDFCFGFTELFGRQIHEMLLRLLFVMELLISYVTFGKPNFNLPHFSNGILKLGGMHPVILLVASQRQTIRLQVIEAELTELRSGGFHTKVISKLMSQPTNLFLRYFC